MHDLVIRNGKIVDGTGAPAHFGDVAFDGGVITSAMRTWRHGPRVRESRRPSWPTT